MPNSDPAIHRQQAKEYYHRNKEAITAKLRDVSPERKAELAVRKKANRLKNIDKVMARDLLPARRMSTAKSMAKKRGHTWTLTLEQYKEIIKNPCFYCANLLDEPVKKGSGLDRIYCERGYEIDNVVSCCSFCNGMKSDKITLEEMKKVAELLIQIRNKKEEV